jgi:DNA-binding transcriptional LysR family regulator
MATYVDIALDLTIGERIVDLVAEGYDLAIRTIPPPDSSMIVRRLTPWRHILCCAPQYLVNHAPPRHPSDLAGHNCLQYAFYPFGDEWRFEDIGAKAISVRVKGNVISNSADALRQLTIDGHGVFLAPSFVIAEELATKAVVPLLPKYRPVEFAINAIYPHRNHLSTKVRCFIDLAAARFVERMAWMNPETPSKKGGSDKHY